MTYHPDDQTATVFATISVNLFSGILFYLLFELFRYQKDIYSSKSRYTKTRIPPLPPRGLFQWIFTTISFSDEATLAFIVYFTSFGHQEGIAGINLYTMGNIQPGGKRLWASCIFCWLYNLYFLYLIHHTYREVVTLRQQYFYSGDSNDKPQKYYSILVENIPFYYRSKTRLYKLFNEWFPNQIHSTSICCNVQELSTLVQKREVLIDNLEKSVAYHEGTLQKKRKNVYILNKNQQCCCSCVGFAQEYDAIDYYSKEIHQINLQIHLLQDQIMKMEQSTLHSPTTSIEKMNQLLSSFINPLLLQHEKDIKQSHSPSLSPSLTPSSYPSPSPQSPPPSQSPPLSQSPPPSHPPHPSLDDDIPPLDELHPHDFGYRSSTGFVTFLSRQTQVQSYQIHVLSDIYSNIEITQAPSIDDILWDNVTATTQQQQHGQRITSLIFTGGMLFWGSVLAFIAAVSNLSNLQKYLPFIKDLDPVVYSLLAGILPVMVMNLFLSLLPAIFTYGAMKIDKRKTKSDVQYEVFRWYFGYQLANVYLMLLAGSLFTALADAIQNPSSIIRLLAAALPSVSVFFINYIITEILTTAPGDLLQLIPFLIWNIYKVFFNEKYLTKRQLFSGPLQEMEFDYGSSLPSYLFILCIVLTYMVIAPLMTLFGFIYFILFYLILKYKFLFVYISSFETGGTFWYGLYTFSMRGLLVSSITMIGYMAVKEGVAQAPFVLPIPFIILRYWSYTMRSFERVSKDMAYSRAVQADSIEMSIKEKIISSFDRSYYTQSCLNVDWNEGPQPYRINNKPLFNSKGELDEVYHNDENEEREGGKEGNEEEEKEKGRETDLEKGLRNGKYQEEELSEESIEGIPLQVSIEK